MHTEFINNQYYNPNLTVAVLLMCRLTFLCTSILVSHYDTKFSLTRVKRFACKKTEEIKEAIEEMELKEFLEERNHQFQSYNIHN